jgi:opacity protein-like surface antigen
MIRRTLLASASAMALTGAALAADLTPVPPPPPVFSWNGFYAGVNVGADIPSDSFATVPLGTLVAAPIDGSLGWGERTSASKVNFEGGGQIGYNWQPIPWIVLGLETDIQGTTAKDNTNNVFVSTDATGTGIVANNFSGHRSWFGTVRGRIGFTLLSYPQLMIYATGGFAYGGSSRSASTTVIDAATGALPWFFPYGSISNTDTGYTVGGGVEWAFLPNWSLKAEYLFVKLPPSDSAVVPTVLTAAPALPTDIMFFHHNSQDNIVRVGLNYRFNWFAPPPVVAKY